MYPLFIRCYVVLYTVVSKTTVCESPAIENRWAHDPHDPHSKRITMPAGRPASATTVYFTRKLDEPTRAILASAGEGDISQGFKTALDIYRALYLRGYTPDQDINCFLDNLR